MIITLFHAVRNKYNMVNPSTQHLLMIILCYIISTRARHFCQSFIVTLVCDLILLLHFTYTECHKSLKI